MPTANTDSVLANRNETTEACITERVFAGAGPSEFRGLSDAYTDEEIFWISCNPAAGRWRDRAIDYLAGE